ncbi:MAG: sulfatase [Pirellulales bacterium]|nr:sulfatase [Pirellulales bacterium]
MKPNCVKLLLLLFLFPLSSNNATAQENPKPLNFVFFLVDDLGWRDLGCYGSPFYETPNVDRLAAGGMRFTDAYAACPVCSPTRASIMVGKYPARMNTTDWFGAVQPEEARTAKRWKHKPLLPAAYVERLPLEEFTVAEAFREAGYKTFFAGKWHLGEEGYWPEQQGFEVNKGGCGWGNPKGGKRYFSPYKNPRLEEGPAEEYLTDRLANETAEFITSSRDEPFLAYLSFYSVHTPLMAPQPRTAKYEKKAKAVAPGKPRFRKRDGRDMRLVQDHAVYAAMVESMDLAVGKVLDTLDELGLADNTAVIFMSDNGGLSTSEGHPTSNLPLRAGKGWLYEGGIREPMIIRWPGKAAAGSVCDSPVTSTDFYPTMLAMADLPARPKQHVDGESLVPLLKQEGELEREAIYWHYPHYGNQGGSPGAAVRSGDWKLIEFFEEGRLELYNLADDLGEDHNLAEAEPERTAKMREMLHHWQQSIDARMPSRNPLAARGR